MEGWEDRKARPQSPAPLCSCVVAFMGHGGDDSSHLPAAPPKSLGSFPWTDRLCLGSRIWTTRPRESWNQLSMPFCPLVKDRLFHPWPLDPNLPADLPVTWILYLRKGLGIPHSRKIQLPRICTRQSPVSYCCCSVAKSCTMSDS